jgi:WD40 repeat protein
VRGEKECPAGGPKGGKEFSHRRSDGRQLFGLDNGVHFSLAFAPDSKTIAVEGGERVYVLERGTGKEPLALEGFKAWGAFLRFSPDGKTLAAAGLTGTVQLWEAGTWQPRATLRGHVKRAWSLAFAPDGKLLATASDDGTVKLWDPVAGQERAAFKILSGWQGRYVAFSPEGGTLAVVATAWEGDRSVVELWDVASGELRSTMPPHPAPVDWVAFAPDGKVMATGCWDKAVRLWDVASGQELATLRGHSSVIYDGAFSPDGRTLATASWDGTVKLWHVASRQELLTLGASREVLWCVAFSPDGQTLAAGTDSRLGTGEVILWQAPVVPE